MRINYTKFFSAFLLILCLPFCIIAQGSLQRASLSSLGSSSSLEGILFRQTIGQPYGTTTNISNDFNYRPGFQQPLFRIINIRQSISANIFPNPTSEEINIETSITINQAKISVLEIAGKEIKHYNYQELKTCKIDCRDLSTGTYILVISDQKSDLSTNKLIVSH